jgi:hypothetical protein
MMISIKSGRSRTLLEINGVAIFKELYSSKYSGRNRASKEDGSFGVNILLLFMWESLRKHIFMNLEISVLYILIFMKYYVIQL